MASNNGSTMVSQLIDTIIVNCIFPWLRFGLGLGSDWENYFGFLVFKILFAAIDTPFAYLGYLASPLPRQKSFKKDFLVDFFDERTRFAQSSCCRKIKKQRVAPPNRSCSGRSGFRVSCSRNADPWAAKNAPIDHNGRQLLRGVDKSARSSLCSSNRRVWRVRRG